MTTEPKRPEAGMLRAAFPGFDQSELISWMVEHGVALEADAEMRLMQTGGNIRHIPLVLRGSVKVTREDEEGREIFLYYILPGETCAMTLSACYKGTVSKINARTQEAGTLVLLPASQIHELTRRFPSWQRFAFDTFGYRFEELLHTLESVVFQQLDERLLHYLLEKSAAMQTKRLHISQQQIADDLNSSREVISRLIRQFEQKGVLRHARGVIEIF